MIKIKNWSKFQHFKDRRPPWIKLHREILDQRDINMISDCSFRVLVGLWMLASEDETMSGALPSIDDIAFRLRKDKSIIIKCLEELKDFFIVDDIKLISSCHHLDVPETETETEKKKETKEKKLKQKKEKISLDDLSVEHIASWLQKKRAEKLFLDVDEYRLLEIFKNWCKSKGKKYNDYVAAYRNAFEWKNIPKKTHNAVNSEIYKEIFDGCN